MNRARHNAPARNLRVGLALFVIVICGGWLLGGWITTPEYTPLSPVSGESNASVSGVEQLFERAVGHMRRHEYPQALNLWHQVLLIEPEIPEVKVNMGFTLFELRRFDTARTFFDSAIEQNPFQANAYYGLALVSEQSGELERAMGEMRSYIHLAKSTEDPRFIRQARAALWEWESRREQPVLPAASDPPSIK